MLWSDLEWNGVELKEGCLISSEFMNVVCERGDKMRCCVLLNCSDLWDWGLVSEVRYIRWVHV